MKAKENAYSDFAEMISQSWTYAKLSGEEKTQLCRVLNSGIVQDAISGTYKERFQILQAVYEAFLRGCGYNGFMWRSSEAEA